MLERESAVAATMINVVTSPETMLRLILNSRVYDVAQETPLDPAPRLSRRLGNEILLKREDLQPIFSYKLRGAYNRIAHLSAEERRRGVIAASAGNPAQPARRRVGDLRAGRRRRPDFRHRQLREGAAPGRQSHRRRALRSGRDVS